MRSQREAVLWIWEAHNQVNQRLLVEEASTDTGTLPMHQTLNPKP